MRSVCVKAVARASRYGVSIQINHRRIFKKWEPVSNVTTMWQVLCKLGCLGSYGRVCAFTRLCKIQQGLGAAKGAFIPLKLLKFRQGKAFQFDWCIEYTYTLRQSTNASSPSRSWWRTSSIGLGRPLPAITNLR